MVNLPTTVNFKGSACLPDIVDKLEAERLIVTSVEEFVESDSAKLMSAKEEESVVMTSLIFIRSSKKEHSVNNKGSTRMHGDLIIFK